MEYTAVIRTLGTAGDKYQTLLDSLASQTIKPAKILVYIAEGYDIPKETIGIEEYIYVKKGMVAQRALQYNEVETEYMLFLDDDLEFPADTVESMFNLLKTNEADVISPDIFSNADRKFKERFLMLFSGRMKARRDDGFWGYKVMRNSGYSYNRKPQQDVYWSQTNAGACLLCKKEDFLRINFDEESWLDATNYALGDDQVMFYKMYKKNLKILTWFKHSFIHLDGGENMKLEKKNKVIYSDFRFKTIFWHRFIYSPEKNFFLKLWDILCISYPLLFTLMISLLKLNRKVFLLKYTAIKDAVTFIKSEEYKQLPKI